MTQRLDTGLRLGWLPGRRPKLRKSMWPPREFGNRIGFSRANRSISSRISSPIGGPPLRLKYVRRRAARRRCQRSSVAGVTCERERRNTSWSTQQRVLAMQMKLHRWGPPLILAADSMTCTTSFLTRRSLSWRETGCGSTRVHALSVSIASLHARSRRRGGVPRRAARRSEGSPFRSLARPREANPENRRQAAPAGDPDCS
jgi:hypothetical protein